MYPIRYYLIARQHKRLIQAALADRRRRLQIKTLLAVFLAIVFALLLTALGA